VGAVASGAGAWALLAGLAVLKARRDAPGVGLGLGAAMMQIARPVTVTDWVQAVGILAFAAIAGVFVAAVAAARHGAAGAVATDESATAQASG
jgi:hypothetical protein